MESLRRDFLITDLKPLIRESGVTGLVTVQARQMVDETEWLLDLAKQQQEIRGVVGWVPLVEESVRDILAKFAANPALKGVRHILHDEPDDDYMLRPDFNRGIRQLRRFGLTYDILIFERHLPQTIRFVQQHPDQVFIEDHIAKPRIRDGVISPWRVAEGGASVWSGSATNSSLRPQSRTAREVRDIQLGLKLLFKSLS